MSTVPRVGPSAIESEKMPRAKPKTTPSDLRVTRLPLADLTPYPKNPRHITPAAVNAVAESLAAFGFQQPIVIDPRKVIVAGHTRRLAALQLGWTTCPTVQIPAKHARAYRLADNRSGEFSTWDLEVLGGELEALPSGLLEALPALQTMGAVMTSEEIEAEWEVGGGGLPAENPGRAGDAVAHINVYLFTKEDVRDFESRLGLEAGTIENKQKKLGQNFLHWPKSRRVAREDARFT